MPPAVQFKRRLLERHAGSAGNEHAALALEDCHAVDYRVVATISERAQSQAPAYLAELREAIRGELAREQPWAAAELILKSPLLDAIPQRLAGRLKSLDRNSAEEIFIDALEILIMHWKEGGRPDRPDAYLWSICFNKAQDEVKRLNKLQPIEDDDLGSPAEEKGPEPSRDLLRREALRVARQALPLIAQERPQQAMALILDALEAEVEMTNADLGERLGVTTDNARKLRERAFRRLEQALDAMGAELTLPWALDLEEREADGDDEEVEE